MLTLAERQMLSDDWRGLASRIDAAFKEPGCNASNWLPVFASAFGYGDEIDSFGARATACDPLNFINISTRLTVALTTGTPNACFRLRNWSGRRVATHPSNQRARAWRWQCWVALTPQWRCWTT